MHAHDASASVQGHIHPRWARAIERVVELPAPARLTVARMRPEILAHVLMGR